ncbi:PAS domain-containing sensor histidine kinase [Pusillimonas noertemannii]|uniref:histidine kinase n=1 Tax=Pusillimonas noertemannii TaxID=305977 RepID=A0A2U1CJR6_9BURK|nr:PAS domain-containing sensor histidine kinase [Pusillimonas noertemannii]NYT69816.1 PAS domain S-box protein [Pusillimonas noertemannii]PVY61260.1 PAS/PAC sensor signal transduction histidine kinase [Pusillimonas noertemannii]TFL09117.1 PAS domain-containing sensor histidine kinase [Pusillimonas noertemannii]
MASPSRKSLIPTTFYDQAKGTRRGLYWLTPVLVLVLYLCVMGAFIWLQRLQSDSVMFVTIDQETRQQRLIMVVVALSCLIILSLLALWRYTRFRSRAEAALIAETGFRRAMENSMSTGMRVFDMQGRIAYVNPAFCRMIGWNEADLIGRTTPFPYWIPGRHAQHQETLDLLLSGRTPSSGLEVEAQRRDGSRFTARMYVSPLRDPNGEQIGWMTSMTDITEPKRIREALTAAHERFMTVLEGLDDAISVVADTPDGLELLFANRTYRRFFGAQSNGHAELLGGRLGRFTDETVEAFSTSAQRWFEVHHRMLAWTDGRRVRLQVARDITERRTHEEASRVQQEKIQLTSRLTTMGEMASSLAHELNQPLTAISNYSMGAVAMLKAGNPRPEQLLEALEKAASQAERAGKIISRIREFVKRSEPRRQKVPISRILDNAIAFADIDARKRQVEIDRETPPGDPTVLADPILIEQVLLNLLKNGVEAMEQSDYRTLHVRVTEQLPLIEIAVIDRGHGLRDPERLFEPFYSTKSEGLGMGLNICRTIIESHHGRLWATANPEGGTIFRFTLPFAAPEAPDQSENSQELHA